MYDDLKAHFYEQLTDLYRRYREVRNDPMAGLSKDMQAAVAAAGALFHFREHLDGLAVPPAVSMTKDQVRQSCHDYHLVEDINDAAKHAHLDRKSAKVSGAGDLHEVIVVTEFSDDQGPYTDARKLVIVRLKDGTEREVFDIATNVMNFWGQTLAGWGIIQSYTPYPDPEPPGSRFLSREEAQGRLDLTILQGVRFKKEFRLQRFDLLSGRCTPIDLTGCNVTAKAYKSKIDVVLTHTQTGEQKQVSLDVSHEQARALNALLTEDEKRAFIRQLFLENIEMRKPAPEKTDSQTAN